MNTTVMTSRGQVAIPVTIRQKLKIKKGARLYVETRNDEIILKSVKAKNLKKIPGILPTKGKLSKMLLDERRKEKENESKLKIKKKNRRCFTILLIALIFIYCFVFLSIGMSVLEAFSEYQVTIDWIRLIFASILTLSFGAIIILMTILLKKIFLPIDEIPGGVES